MTVSLGAVPTAALFVTCVADQLFPATAEATVRVLESAGVHVDFPAAQTCCGQPALTAGEPAAAARLVHHFLDVFGECEAIVAPSGSCAAMVHHWYERLVPERASDARAVAAKTFELSQYLVEVLNVRDVGARLDGTTVTVHDACHALRNLGVGNAPRELLRAAGATIFEMVEADTCCGFGGVFATSYPEVSTHLADAKLDHAADTGGSVIVTTDLACAVHLDGRGARRRDRVRTVHLADLLASGLAP